MDTNMKEGYRKDEAEIDNSFNLELGSHGEGRAKEGIDIPKYEVIVERASWSGKLGFILSCLSFAVGLGNVWRFPYQCYKNGGGAFLFPFVFMLLITGLPLFFLETSFGQYASSGIISIWRVCPLFSGIGSAMFFVSFFVSIYYNILIAWSFYYLFSSFKSPLPWATCENAWNTAKCRVQVGRAGCDNNATCSPLNMTGYVSPSDEYFHRNVLAITEGLHDLGSLRWEIVLCSLLSWAVIAICMIKGIKSSGRAVYFTSTFPYLVLFILLVRGVTLEGASNGILFYLTPQWDKLLSANVWGDAAVQIFFSLAPGWGGLITLSSYSKFHNNALRDAYIVCFGDILTSIFAGLVVFSIIGFMAHELQTDVDKVLAQGPGLAFIAYPEVVTQLPIAPFWAILFFLMLITLGLGTQFAIINTVHTTIVDLFPKVFLKGHRSSFLMVSLCLLCFLLGLGCCLEGGMYVLKVMDSYSATYAVLFIALVECIVLVYIYGYDQLVANIQLMLGFKIGLYWKIMWKFVSPAFLIVIIVFIFLEFSRMTYRTYTLPWEAEVVGALLPAISVLSIPAVAVYKIATCHRDLPILQRIKRLCQPAPSWGPAHLNLPKLAEKYELNPNA